MDSSSIDSDIPDLLQFLQYPTSPAVELSDSVFNASCKGGTRILRYRNKVLESTSCLLDTAAATIHEDRSFLAITGLLSRNPNAAERGDQPDARRQFNATLVPRELPAQTQNGHKRRKHPIKIHRSASKYDHQRSELLYLVVSRGKDELFQLRSPQTSENNVRLNSLRISPALYDYSARMAGKSYRGKDKKKGKEKVLEEKGVGYDAALLNDKGTDCPPNQVKIYGRIGVTKDDKYVMDCEATINDKPIETRIFTRSNSPMRAAAAADSPRSMERPGKQNPLDVNHFTLIESRKSTRSQCVNEQSPDYLNRINTFAQTGLCEVTIDSEPPLDDSSSSESYRFSKETQGTQADFNVRIKKALDSSCLSHGYCDCDETDDHKTAKASTNTNSQHIRYDTNARSSEEPIVVISVYPKKAVIEKRNLKDFANINNMVHKNQQPHTSGSPKAARSRLTNDGHRDEKINRIMKIKTGKNPFSKENMVMTVKNTNAKVVNKVERDSSPKGNRTKPNNNKPLPLQIDREPTNSKPLKQDALVKNQKSDPKVKSSPTRVGKVAKENQTSNRANKTVTKSTNTDLKHHVPSRQEQRSFSQTVHHGQKSALRTVLENVFGQPKRDVSNVTVNIDAENEYYNVFLHRDPRTTGVKVTKVTKEDSTKHFNPNPTSAENNATNPLDCSGRKISDAAHFNEERTRCGCVNGGLTVEGASGVCKNRDRCDLVRALQELGLMICPRDDQKHCRKSSLPRQEPSKHFRGDDCPLSNPVERDKQVRRLLGVSVGVDNLSPPATMQTAQNTELQQCLRDHPAQCTKSHKMRIYEVVNKNTVRCRCYRCLECSETPQHRAVTVATQYEQQGFQTSSLYRDLTSDFATNVFSKRHLHLYQDENKNATFFVDVTKHKPIVLTRTQYAKVKKSIQTRLSQHSRDAKRSFKRTSIVSIGETRRRRNAVRFAGTIEKSIQTDGGHLETRNLAFGDVKQSTSALIARAYNIHKRLDALLPPVSPRRTLSSVDTQWKNVAFKKTMKVDEADRKMRADFNLWRGNDLRSREMNYSLHTIYKSNKGKKRSATPNLGASLDSLLGDGDTAARHTLLNKSLKFLMTPRVEKKKPFLRRLMSCLVMRTKTSHFDLNTDKPPLSVECSDTTYHISTSLAPMEMSSSMYDTSVSFYTDHVTLPINSKMKKGFISSVKGFLKKN